MTAVHFGSSSVELVSVISTFLCQILTLDTKEGEKEKRRILVLMAQMMVNEHRTVRNEN